jgi:hypothetical protein
MQNVLFSDKQRALLSFQKANVLESGSTSQSDDFYYKLAVVLRHDNTETYLKSIMLPDLVRSEISAASPHLISVYQS